MKNPWITYIGRSYNTIKSSLLSSLATQVPELTDRSPSNLFIVLLDMFASIGEVLNYYIDSSVRELYPITAKRYSSLLKLGNFLNYTGKAKIPASSNILFTFDGTGSKPLFVIPNALVLTDSIGNKWLTTHSQEVPAEITEVIIPAIQVDKVNDFKVGTSNGTASQRFELPIDYAHGSLEVEIDSVLWSSREVLGFSNNTDKHFTVEVYVDGKVYLIFGDGVNGVIPTTAKDIYITYFSTKGLDGNIPENQIKTLTTTFEIPNGFTVTITNPQPAYGGYNLENLTRLRRSIPLSLRTLNRAVTRQDYEDIATLAPGVRIAKLDYVNCDDPINIYIVPNEGGIPSDEIIASTKDYVESHGMFTLPINILPSGESKVRIKLTIEGEYGISQSTIEAETKAILSELYSPYTAQINKSVLVSDIISPVHNLKEVNNVLLDFVYLVPYLRPNIVGTFLDYDIKIRPGSNTIGYWRLTYSYSTGNCSLILNGETPFTILASEFGTWKEDIGNLNIMDIVINTLTPGPTGEDITWEFFTYPYNTNILLNDFSIPVLDVANLELNITEHVRLI